MDAIVALIIGFAVIYVALALVRLILRRGRGGGGETAGVGVPTWWKLTWTDVIYGLVMIAGIFAKEAWDRLNETGQIGLLLPRLFGALLIAPIIYAAIYSQFVKDGVSVLGLCIAFQNGFFWQAVFKTVQE